jgi:RNA polymerase sigma-70 factor (ECF subfamily)
MAPISEIARRVRGSGTDSLPAAPRSSTDRPTPTDAGFEQFFRAHYARVLAYIVRRLPDRAAAEDLAAETFLIAWRRRDDIPADPVPWLFVVARNGLNNSRRSARRRDELAQRLGAQAVISRVDANPDGRVDIEQQRLMQALARLKEADREVLMLSTWDGLDRSRAAAVLGCSEDTFSVRLHRARRRLASVLGTTAEQQEDKIDG